MRWVFIEVVTTRRGPARLLPDVNICGNRMGGGIPSLPQAARFTAKNLLLGQRDRVWGHFHQELTARLQEGHFVSLSIHLSPGNGGQEWEDHTFLEQQWSGSQGASESKGFWNTGKARQMLLLWT